MRTLAVLPSRFQASRFPGKPLALISGRPMIQWVWEAARDARGVDAVVVATDDVGTVLGFGSLSTYRDRPSYSTTVENSVYVDEEHRGEGVGRALLDELVRLGTLHGFHSMIARVGGDNAASIALHGACGFVEVGVEREIGRKFNRWLDVAVLQRMLGGAGIGTEQA